MRDYQKAFEKTVEALAGQVAAGEKMVQSATELESSARALWQSQQEAMAALSARASALMIGFALAGVVLGIVLATTVTRSLTGPISRCMESIVALANQDFGKRCDLERKDEIGRMAAAVNRSIDATRKAFEDVQEGARREKQAEAERAEAERQRVEAERQHEAAEAERERAQREAEQKRREEDAEVERKRRKPTGRRPRNCGGKSIRCWPWSGRRPRGTSRSRSR